MARSRKNESWRFQVDNALKSALVSYTNTDLIGVIGDENAGSGESGGDNPGGEGGGGEQGGGDNPGSEITADVECSFVNGIPSNSLFTVTGSKGECKGDKAVTFNGQTYESGLKLDSKGSVTFTTTETMNMTLVLSNVKGNNTVKVDGTNMSGEVIDNYYLVTVNNLQAGEHKILKGTAEGLLIYIGLTKVE